MVALPEEMPVNETAALERELASEVGVDGRQDLLQRPLPGALPPGGGEADRGGGAGCRPGRARRAAAPRSPRSAAAAISAEQLARLERETKAPVSTLPFLFEPELGPEQIGALAGMATA